MRRFATLLAATAAIATTFTVTPASAITPPPNAWTCEATVTGVQVDHNAVPNVANTLAVHSVTGLVTCELTGVLTHAPVDYLPLYQGGMSLHVHSSDGGNQRCGGTLDEYPSAGPTLVLAATAVCTWAPTTGNVTYWPYVYWSTMDLNGNNVTIAGEPGVFLN